MGKAFAQKCVSLQVAVDVGAGVGIMSALAVVHGKLGHVHAVEAPFIALVKKGSQRLKGYGYMMVYTNYINIVANGFIKTTLIDL